MYTYLVLLTPSPLRPAFASELESRNVAEATAGRPTFASAAFITSVAPARAGKPVAPRVVIDWADIALDGIGVGAALNLLLEWVRTSPEPSEIQVVLPPVRRSPEARRLQGSLQSLGCTVTLRWHSRQTVPSLGRRYAT